MQIGEVARRAGVTTKAVRYYELLGLLTPERLANGYRDYSHGDVRLAREIKSLGQLGIGVSQTRPFLDCLAAGHDYADDCPASLASYRDAIATVTHRIEELTARRATLTASLHEAAHRGSLVPLADQSGDSMTTDYTSLPAGLPVPEDDGATAHLSGIAAPHLELPAIDGSSVHLDALGAGRTVIYLYPLTGRPGVDLPEGWDTIPGARGCSTEACSFRDHYEELVEAGAARVYGLSSQDSDYQNEVVERLQLPFLMLSDTSHQLAAQLNLPTFEAGGATLYKRITLVLRDNTIEHVFYPIFPPNEHAQQVLDWLHTA